jgi:hypothetical protein
MGRTLALALSLAAVAAQPAVAQPAVAERGYALRFRVDAPAGWEVVRDRGMVRLAVLAPAGPGAFRPNVNVVVEGVAAGTALDAYVARTLDGLASQMPGFRVVEAGPAALGGRGAYRLVYEHAAAERPLRALVYVVVEGGRAFVLTATAPLGAFDRYLPAFERVCQSLRTGPDGPPAE